jgi:MFS family permease
MLDKPGPADDSTSPGKIPIPSRAAAETQPIVAPRRGLAQVGRALRNENFRLFFSGQSISLIGTWMQQLALSWLVFQVTRDEFWMSLVSFSSQIPSLLLVPFAGVIIDRVNKLRLIIGTQVLLMVQAVLLALLVDEHLGMNLLLIQVIALALMQGCLNAFDMPARQAFLPEMLHNREDLANAIALNSSLFHGARMVGPALAAFVLATAGFQACFWLNAVSYVAVLTSLMMMRVSPSGARSLLPGGTGPIVPSPAGSADQPTMPAGPRMGGFIHGFREGLSYAIGFRPIRAILGLVALTSLLGLPYTVFIPFYAGQIFHGDAKTLGIMMTASGIGALTGALYMASRPTVLGLGKKIVIGSLMFSTGLIAFSHAPYFWLAVAVLPFTGFGLMVQMASCNTILQTIVEDRMRGRVMSLFTMSFMGIAPFGTLTAGILAKQIGTPMTILIGGVGCLLGGLYIGRQLGELRRLVRPLYVERGILGQSE